MSAFTPGPWVVQQLNHVDGELWLQIGYEKPDGTRWGPICRTSSPAEPMPDGVVAEIKYMATSNENQLANAQLISAAPELLAACQTALEHVVELREAWMLGAVHEHDGGSRSNRNVDVETALRAAIAKATWEA